MNAESELEARRWLDQAEHDLAACRLMLREEFYDQACFLSQQIAEKAFKALAYYRGDQMVLDHTLTDLIYNLETTFPQISEFHDLAETLGAYYIPTRYPDALPSGAPFEIYTQEEAQEAVDGAERIITFAKSIIG